MLETAAAETTAASPFVDTIITSATRGTGRIAKSAENLS
jgi:hypothetical protein